MKINSNTVIIGKKIVLVPYKKLHVEKYWKWMSSEEIREQTASEELTLEEEYANQISWNQDNHKITFIILDKDLIGTTNEEWCNNNVDLNSMIGDVNIFFNEYEEEGTGELEVMIAEQSSRRKGLGKEAIQLIMSYGIDKLNVLNYIVKIGESNNASINMFKSMNFIQIGEVNVFKEILLKYDKDSFPLSNLIENDYYKSLIFKNWE